MAELDGFMRRAIELAEKARGNTHPNPLVGAVIVEDGKIVAEGTPLELKNRYTGDFISLYHVSEEQVKALGCPYTALADGFRLEVKDTAQATRLILANTALFVDYEITKGKMDDVFLAVTGKKLTGGAEG